MAFSRYEDFLNCLKTASIDSSLEEPQKRWKDSLRAELGDGCEVFMPSMPNKQNAKYEEWKLWFERHLPSLRDGVILVGHSQGGYFLVKYLCENTLPVRVRALMLVAAPFESADFGGEDGGDFNFDAKELPRLEEQVREIVIFHSKDDEAVSFSHALKYQKAIPSITLVPFEDRGHFLDETFLELVGYIRATAAQS
jgi:predicted alpha/beta hydrolase family esterase